MHPLIARIHPALRTAFFAWLLSRSAIWVMGPSHPLAIEGGPPLPGLVAEALTVMQGWALSGPLAGLVEFTPWLVVEAAMLAAGVLVYRFARKTDLPQYAERACWLWFFNPVVALYATDWGAQMAIAFGTLTVAAVATRRPRMAAVAAVIAVGCRLELILLWPALCIAAWRNHRPEKQPAWTLLLSVGTLPMAFAAWIGASWHLAGAANTSLRTLDGGLALRQASTAIPSSTPEWITVIAVGCAAVIALRYLRRFPLWYTVCAVPAIVWPLIHSPSQLAAITVAWSLPTFIHLAVATDDRAVERPLLVAVVGAFFALVIGG